MIQGDVFTFLGALGALEGDVLLQEALTIVGGDVETEVFIEDDVELKYLIMAGRGVTFLLEDGVVTTVFIYALDTDSQSAYLSWDTLVLGVNRASSPADIQSVLGTPVKATHELVRYDTGSSFVQFEFKGDQLKLLAMMSTVIGGD